MIVMKALFRYRVKIFFLLATLAAMFSCSDDELNSPLTGTWEGVSFTASEAVDENQDGVAHTDLKEENDCVSMEAEFTSHGRFSITSSDISYDISIVNGEVVLTPKGCVSTTESGHWSLDANATMLILEFDIEGKDDPTVVNIQIELSDQNLVMKDLLYSEDPPITYTVEFHKK